jgi:hypothetical protein
MPTKIQPNILNAHCQGIAEIVACIIESAFGPSSESQANCKRNLTGFAADLATGRSGCFSHRLYDREVHVTMRVSKRDLGQLPSFKLSAKLGTGSKFLSNEKEGVIKAFLELSLETLCLPRRK